MKKVEVVAAIVQYENKILCVQRGPHKLPYISQKYEFPGGKIEAGETHQTALKREMIEELSMEVEVQDLLLTIVHPYPDFELTMHVYLCQCPSPKLTLTEHIAFQWLPQDQLHTLDWAAADVPVVDKLMLITSA